MKTPRSSSTVSPAPHLRLEAGSARTASLPHAPQDLSESWTAFLIYRAGEALMTAPFLPFLPLWMPLCWLALNFATNSAVQWIRKRPAYSQQPAARHLFTDRLLFLVTYGGAGTAAFFLYVPGNVGMLCILGICIVCVGVLSILQTAGDNWRGSIGAGLVVLPTATRFLFEDGSLMPTLGLGGFVLVAALTLLGRRQADAFMEQVELRQRAEHAADAVAGVGLAKARFFAAVSHDLRQPVHAIGLYLAALPDMVHDPRGRKAVNGIHQALRVLDDMLSQVLDLTRMDSGGLQPQIQEVEVEPLLRGLAVQYSAAAERKSIRLVVLAAPRRYVLADSLMLKRSLSNLLDNAIKFSAEDGRIVMALRSRGSDWCIQVRDAGEGIHKDLHAKVFEEFVQVHNPERDRTRGVGLGLTIARRFVGLMQGQLRMRSAPGAGTCFSVLLPKASVLSTQPETAAAWVGGPHGSPEAPAGPEMESLQVPAALTGALARTGKAILLVEDDALVSEAIVQLFKDLGLPVVMAVDASAARALAHRACVAACDIRLPGELSGLDLAVELQAKRAMPCLLMTGETAADVRAVARSHNLPLLVKPIKPQTLLDELGSLCSGLTPGH